MGWIAAALVSLLVLVAFWKLLGSQPLGRNQGWQDFEHGVHALLLAQEDGGSLHVQHRASEIAFDLVRAEGADSKAVVVLRIPRAHWSEGRLTELVQVFESQGLDVSSAGESSEVLAEVRVPVADVFEEWSGARGARAEQLLLECLGIPRDARFDFSLVGPPSKRLLEHYKRLRQQERA